MLQAVSITTGLQPRKLLCTLAAGYLQFIFKYKVCVHVVVYTVHAISQNIDSGASAPVVPSLATPLLDATGLHLLGLKEPSRVKVNSFFIVVH